MTYETFTDLRTWARFCLTLALGAVGGALFYWLDLPLAWMLGSMAVSAIAAIFKVPVGLPYFVRPPMSAVIGIILGSSVTPAVIAQAPQWIIPLAILPFFLIVSAICSITYFRRIAGLDMRTAYFCGMPGGLVEMVLLGADYGADERMISLVHALRVFLVVLLLPFFIGLFVDQPMVAPAVAAPEAISIDHIGFALLAIGAGMIIGHVFRMPVKYMLGPMLVSAGLHVMGITEFQLPAWLAAFAQIVLGATIGCRFRGVSHREILRIGGLSFGAVLLLLLITGLFAEVTSLLSGYDFTAVLLAYSPGGLAEMSLIAYALNIEVMFVFSLHVARVILVALGAGLMFKRLF
jgi:membrane AbrB-like protein